MSSMCHSTGKQYHWLEFDCLLWIHYWKTCIQSGARTWWKMDSLNKQPNGQLLLMCRIKPVPSFLFTLLDGRMKKKTGIVSSNTSRWSCCNLCGLTLTVLSPAFGFNGMLVDVLVLPCCNGGHCKLIVHYTVYHGCLVMWLCILDCCLDGPRFEPCQ